MYLTLTDSELLVHLPHSRVILYDIISILHGSLFNIPSAFIVFPKNANLFLRPCMGSAHKNGSEFYSNKTQSLSALVTAHHLITCCKHIKCINNF